MKFAYTIDGTVTGLNSAGVAPEITGNCTPQELVWGMVTEYYKVTNGNLAPRTQAEINVIVTAAAKESAYTKIINDIEDKKREENLKSFEYNGEFYVSDQVSIQSTQNDCLTLEASSPINTLRGTPYEGRWAAIGNFIAFTAGEFILFANAYFIRGSDNFTTRSTHIMNVRALMADASKTAADIESYDYNTGWH